jgi:hypothetical protein
LRGHAAVFAGNMPTASVGHGTQAFSFVVPASAGFSA